MLELTGGGVDAAFEAIGLTGHRRPGVPDDPPGCVAYVVGVPAAGAMLELPGAQLLAQNRGLQGLFMGGNDFKRDIPMLASLYLQGRLKLDELVAARITLDEVNDGYEVMRRGTEARSVIIY